jgi:hypothetical protein
MKRVFNRSATPQPGRTEATFRLKNEGQRLGEPAVRATESGIAQTKHLAES